MKALAFSFFTIAGAQSVWAEQSGFVGKLVLEPPNCQTSGQCTLGEDFGYIDPRGVGWQAQKGNVTDGASIPVWAQPFVGVPFEPAYIRAAIIHDHYCDRNVRTWQETHRVFFDALLSSGVDRALAEILYGAVYLGGSRWRDTIPGIGCPVGKICVANVNRPAPKGTQVRATDEGGLVIFRPVRYGTPDFESQFAQLKAIIEAQPGTMTPEAISEEANKLFADVLFSSDIPYGLLEEQ